MREITLKTGKRKTTIPMWFIRKIVKEVYGDTLSISARKKRVAADKRKLKRKRLRKKESK